MTREQIENYLDRIRQQLADGMEIPGHLVTGTYPESRGGTPYLTSLHTDSTPLGLSSSWAESYSTFRPAMGSFTTTTRHGIPVSVGGPIYVDEPDAALFPPAVARREELPPFGPQPRRIIT